MVFLQNGKDEAQEIIDTIRLVNMCYINSEVLLLPSAIRGLGVYTLKLSFCYMSVFGFLCVLLGVYSTFDFRFFCICLLFTSDN